jgi:hypothetical protein
MPPATMTSIIRNCKTGQKTTHISGKTNISAAQKNVGMIGHQRPGIDAGFCPRSQLSQAFDKVFAISNIIDYPTLIDPSQYNMVQGSRGIQSRSSRHPLSSFSYFYTSDNIFQSTLSTTSLILPFNGLFKRDCFTLFSSWRRAGRGAFEPTARPCAYARIGV